MRFQAVLVGSLVLFAATSTIVGCSELVNKDNIVIARLDGKNVTRGDLNAYIRERMGDILDETKQNRPRIQTKADRIAVLNEFIDERITSQIADELADAGKIAVPREQAAEAYFRKVPEDRLAYRMQGVEGTDLTEAQLNAKQAAIEFRIDDEMERLLREAAVQYLIQEGIQTGSLRITDEEFERAYNVQKLIGNQEVLMSFETIAFFGIRFPVTMPNAIEKAAEVYRRITEGGESFDDVFEEYLQQNPALVMNAAFENNNPRFQLFWERIPDSPQPGDIIGPVLLPEHQEVRQTPSGQTDLINVPDSHVVLKVDEYAPAREKTAEEARRALAPQILENKVMERLRDEHGVEVYEDKVEDPAAVS